MKRARIFFKELFSPRIPQLYYGSNALGWNMTEREKLADDLYVALKILSEIVFILLGIAGYFLYQFYGFLIFAILGYSLGAWIRRSLGVRGLKHTTGFFTRMRERARGARPGFLEAMLEKISNHPLTIEECKNLALLYDRYIKQIKQAQTSQERNVILAELDKRVKQIAYG